MSDEVKADRGGVGGGMGLNVAGVSYYSLLIARLMERAWEMRARKWSNGHRAEEHAYKHLQYEIRIMSRESLAPFCVFFYLFFDYYICLLCLFLWWDIFSVQGINRNN